MTKSDELKDLMRSACASYEAAGVNGTEGARAMREGLARIEELEAELAWQPIETAPRDGTAFLGYNPKYSWVGTVRYDLVDDDEPEIGNPNWEFLGSTVTCTHWMPLPAPPSKN